MTRKTLQWDFYQTDSIVTVSIRTGIVQIGEEPSVKFTPTACVLQLSNGEKWKLELPYVIKPGACIAKPAGQRLELKLAKEDQTQRWAKISDPMLVYSEESPLEDNSSAKESVAISMPSVSDATASSPMQQTSNEQDKLPSRVNFASQAAQASNSPAVSQDVCQQLSPSHLTSGSTGSQRTFSLPGATSSSGLSTSAESTFKERVSSQAPPSPQHVKVVECGHTGMANIGNTCFMNSALQCLSHTRELRHFFFEQRYLEDLNADNPLGFGGQLANAFGKLLVKLWSGYHEYVSPKRLQSLVSAKISQFGNFGQHDAQEFLAFFMDGLHEDLNRVRVKPYHAAKDTDEEDGRAEAAVAEEAWLNHNQRNHSFFTTHFQGQFKSTVICPQCNKVSVTFDPFMHMSVPLPKPTVTISAYFIPREMSKRPVRYKLVVGEKAGLSIARAALAKKCGVNLRQLRCYTAQNGRMVFVRDQPWKSVGNIGSAYFIGMEVLSREEVGEDVVEIPLVQRAVPPPSTCCSACYRKGTNLQRCTKCYLTSYCDRQCQMRHWRTHKSTCQFKRLPTGVPCLISLPKSEVTFKHLAELAEHYSRLSVEVTDVVPPSPTQSEGESSAGLIITANSGSAQAGACCQLSTESNSFLVENADRSGQASQTNVLSEEGHFTEQVSNLSSDTGGIKPTHSTSVEMNGVVQPPNCVSLTTAKEVASESNGSANTSPASEKSATIDTVSVNGSTVSRGQQASNSDPPQSNGGDPAQPPPPKSRFLLTLVEGLSLKQQKRLEEKDGELIDVGRYTLCLDWRNQPKGAVDVRTKPLMYDEDASVTDAGRVRQNITLQQCLELFTDPEKLEADQTWYCPRCKKHREATKEMSLWKVPNLLVVHLKRFSSPLNKIAKNVSFPLMNLNLGPYRAKGCPSNSAVYDLYAVINHYGGSWGGHYTAFCREESDDLDDDCPEKWLEFDDHVVSEVSSSAVVSSAAYVLFYRKRRSRTYDLFGSVTDSDSSDSTSP